MAKPHPSEWGKLSQGQNYMPLALDIARAFSALGLGENVGILLWHVIEHSWKPAQFRRRQRDGWPDPRPVSIVYAELGTLWGIAPQRVYDAKKWLVAARLLIEEPEGLYVNKDAHEWVNPKTGEPLLTPRKLAYAASQRSRGAAPESNGVPLDAGNHASNVGTLGHDVASNGRTLDAGQSSNVATLDSNIEDRARGNSDNQKEKSSSRGAVASPESKNESDLARLCRIARGAFGKRFQTERLDEAIGSWLDAEFPAATIERFLQAAKHSADGPVAAYVNSCLYNGREEAAKKKAASEPKYHRAAAKLKFVPPTTGPKKPRGL